MIGIYVLCLFHYITKQNEKQYIFFELQEIPQAILIKFHNFDVEI